MRTVNQVSVVGERNTRIRVAKLPLRDLRRSARLQGVLWCVCGETHEDRRVGSSKRHTMATVSFERPSLKNCMACLPGL